MLIGALADHDDAIQLLLGQIRDLSQFPEAPERGASFTARWPEET